MNIKQKRRLKRRRRLLWLLALMMTPLEAAVVFLAEETGPLWRAIQRRYDMSEGGQV
ncbi:MAG: hypothetical protein K5867_04090 [Bacteroidales bacterium]|nr:hypothetical protein [Bacteroidales bacterium]